LKITKGVCFFQGLRKAANPVEAWHLYINKDEINTILFSSNTFIACGDITLRHKGDQFLSKERSTDIILNSFLVPRLIINSNTFHPWKLFLVLYLWRWDGLSA